MYTKSIIWRYVVATAICSAVLMAFYACEKTDNGIDNPIDEPTPKTVEVTKITITPPASVDLTAGGGTMALAVTVEPANATDKTVTWSSSDNTIATVSATGVITGLKEGTVTITATSKDGKITSQFTVTVKPDPKLVPIELKSPISVNTTLKDLGLPVDYIYTGNNLLQVSENATLTIEPGVTIQFTNNGRSGGIDIKSGSTIKAVGTASNRIQFIGAYEAAGTWAGITITSNTDNQFVYCDFLNMGNASRTDYGGIQLSYATKVGFSHCKFTNGMGTGVRASSYGGVCQFSAFDNNTFEGYDNFPPMDLTSLTLLEKFDMTSDFTKNAKKYIEVRPEITKDVTLNQTTVPYFFNSYINDLSNTLTINEGVTIYVSGDFITTGGGGADQSGRLMINGTATKKVKITRLPNTSSYWGRVAFWGLKGSVVNNCIFEYGGHNSGVSSAILCINRYTDLTLNNVEINNADAYGVWILNCGYKLTHKNVTFSNCGLGNVYDYCANPTVVRNHFP